MVHQSGTKTHLHIPIISGESEMKTLVFSVCVCVCVYTYCTASELHWLKNVFLGLVGVMCLNEMRKFSDTTLHTGND